MTLTIITVTTVPITITKIIATTVIRTVTITTMTIIRVKILPWSQKGNNNNQSLIQQPHNNKQPFLIVVITLATIIITPTMTLTKFSTARLPGSRGNFPRSANGVMIVLFIAITAIKKGLLVVVLFLFQ